MKVVLACHGVRGDVEPSVVIGRELQRRGHQVGIAVPPNLVGFARAAGLAAVAWGGDSQVMMDAQRDYWSCLFRTPWRAKELERLGNQIGDIVTRCWTEESLSVLASLARDADVLVAGYGFEQFSANLAEYHDIPLVTVHFFPTRANGQVLPLLPARLGHALMEFYERLSWSGPVKEVEDLQRRALGLRAACAPWPRRIAERGYLEIQGYDDVVVPGLASEWAAWGDRRPFVGTLTLESPTDGDEDVLSWVRDGPPPVFFGFGSVPARSPDETIHMIGAVCERLGQRALIGAGSTEFGAHAHRPHVRVVDQVNYGVVLPRCRAIVHHSGAGTIAAAMRAGIPQVGLWTLPDQSLRTRQLRRLKVGAGRRFSTTTEESLTADLRSVLAPGYRERARDLSARMTAPADSAAAAADLVEQSVRAGRVC